MVNIIGPLLDQGPACEPVIASLPDWFGIPEANHEYVRGISTLPTFLAYEGKRTLGFCTVKQHYEHAAEIYVCGVLPEFHRQGLGTALLEAAEAYLRQVGVEYLQVKTLSSSHPDPFYARTRRFYQKCGFRPLEELPQLWGDENPCLIMIKGL